MSSRRMSVVTGTLLLVPILAACGGRASGPETGDVPTRSVGSVLTAEEIDNSNRTFNSVQELLLIMPGIVLGRGGVQIVGLGGTPLYVVNGVPMSDATGALSLNPRDVERIEVLRSGGATAQYGFRGANGVILIDTKR